MSDNQFDTNEEIQAILLGIITAKSGRDALPMLTAASNLDDEARVYIADKLEQKIAIESFGMMNAEDMKELKVMTAELESARKTNDFEQLLSLEEECADFISMSQVFYFISENKGDKASPFVKLYAEEIAKLSDTEYALAEKHMNVLCIAVEKAQGISPEVTQPKTNPFRKKSPGL
ncbi:MAG: hypothetical protein HY052_00275 [Proteobacteria bacterium]|nr:hypothetical protein [Pseudomonadota bacterium]